MSAMRRRGPILLGAAWLAVAACAGPVGTTRVDPKVAYRELARSAITTGEPSWPTRNVLFEHGLFDAYHARPETALGELHRAMVKAGADPDLLFALAELSFLHGQAARKPEYALAAAVYAYAFLFPEGHGQAPGRFDPRLRTAADLYNWALAAALASKDGSEVLPRGGMFALPFGQLEVAFDPAELRAGDRELHHFIPVASSVKPHSIIAVDGDGPVEKGNDGVVEYSSAHIEPVESELVVQPSSHSTQGNPKTIEEVRRILRLHADVKGS